MLINKEQALEKIRLEIFKKYRYQSVAAESLGMHKGHLCRILSNKYPDTAIPKKLLEMVGVESVKGPVMYKTKQ